MARKVPNTWTNTVTMKLWRISQDTNTGYDTYSDAVVAALTEGEARNIHPGSTDDYFNPEWDWVMTWVPPEQVKVLYIGRAALGITQGVICASFHAG